MVKCFATKKLINFPIFAATGYCRLQQFRSLKAAIPNNKIEALLIGIDPRADRLGAQDDGECRVPRNGGDPREVRRPIHLKDLQLVRPQQG